MVVSRCRKHAHTHPANERTERSKAKRTGGIRVRVCYQSHFNDDIFISISAYGAALFVIALFYRNGRRNLVSVCQTNTDRLFLSIGRMRATLAFSFNNLLLLPLLLLLLKFGYYVNCRRSVKVYESLGFSTSVYNQI